MKIQDLDTFIAKHEDHIRRLDAELSAAKALRLVLIKHEHGEAAAENSIHIQRHLNGLALRPGYGSTVNAIKNAILEKCPEEFSIYDIEQALSDSRPDVSRESISQCLCRWRGDKIQVKTPGAGRKPTIYTKEGCTLRKALPKKIVFSSPRDS
jgi:hypothetical protein